MTATREFPAPFIPRNLGPLNKASYSMANVATLMFKKELAAAVNALPPAPRPVMSPRATLIPISPLLLHRPADWPASVHLTGHWTRRSSSSEDTDQELKNFMGGGDFVYAGFGSMKAGDASARGEAIVEAARRNGLRVLVASGWGGIDVPTEAKSNTDLLVRESVDHQAVLPSAVAAIHHGGAGSVHAVVRAAIPSVVVPFIADQPFWGHLVHQRGLGPAPIPHRKLTADRLTGALTQAGKYRKQAARTGELMQKENGTAVALDVLENLTGS